MIDTVFFADQDEFNDWLEERPNATEVWVGYFRKNSGRATLTWSESVDVALCHGWIDDIRKTIDEQSYKIRFTPRKKGSVWSAVNVNKVEALSKLGKMKPAGMALFNNRSDVKGYSAHDKNVPFASKYKEQLRSNSAAWAFFSGLCPIVQKRFNLVGYECETGRNAAEAAQRFDRLIRRRVENT